MLAAAQNLAHLAPLAPSALQTLLENATDILMVFGRDLRCIYASPSVVHLTGRAPADLVGKGIDELEALPAQRAWRAALDSILAGGDERELLVDRDTPQGKRRLAARIVPSRGPDGAVTAAVAITRDITDEWTMRLFDAAMQTMPVAVAVVEAPSARVLFANAACDRIWGLTTPPDQRVARFERYVGYHPDGRQLRPDEWPVARSLRGGEVVPAQRIEIVRPDGSRAAIRVTSAPIRDRDGSIVAAITTFHDMTEQERVERDQAFLAQASMLLSDTLDTSTALQTLARLAVPAIADWCAIHLIDEDGAVRLVSTEHVDPTKLAAARAMARRYPAENRPTSGIYRILHGGPSELYADIPDELLASMAEDEEHLAFSRSVGLRSAMAVPIQGRTARLGVITFVTAETHRRYNQADLAVAEDLGRRAGLAVENARLYESERAARRAAEQAVHHTQRLQLLSMALAHAVEEAKVAAILVQAGQAALGAQAGFAWLLDEDRGALEMVASAGVDSPRVAQFRTIPVDAEVPLCDAIRRAEPLLFATADELAARYPRAAGPSPFRSWAVMPFLSGGKGIGGASFSFTTERRFTEEERTLIAAMASQASLALERCRLFEAERKARAQAEALYRSVKESEERARLADRRKDEFLALLGHELRNPLAPIATALELMRLKGDPRTREREVIERQVGHLTRLIDDLLDVSRITRGKIQLARERVDLASVIAKAVETVSPLLEKRFHHLEIAVPRQELIVDADPVRLAQVFQNLLTNAAKYTEPHGRVAIAARREDHEVVVTVSDNGIGIAPALLPLVFDMFTQGERSIDRAEGGLGIGLTLVKRLVELHGGSVAARSEGVGRGSELSVRLPVVAQEAPARAVAGAGDAGPGLRAGAAGGHRVLVVDDNADAADTIADVLRELGHQVATAHDGPAALELVERFEPQAVLLDIGLPVMDGYEVARRLREDLGLRDIMLIAVTGYGQEQDRARSAEAGFDQHLVKPVNVVDVHRLLLADQGQ